MTRFFVLDRAIYLYRKAPSSPPVKRFTGKKLEEIIPSHIFPLICILKEAIMTPVLQTNLSL